MNKTEQIIEELNNSEEYILKIKIYEMITDFIENKQILNIRINKLLNELLYINRDKLKYFLSDKELLNYELLEKNLNDEEVEVLVSELIRYEKQYLF